MLAYFAITGKSAFSLPLPHTLARHEARDFLLRPAEPFTEHFGGVLTQQGRRLHLGLSTTHDPRRAHHANLTRYGVFDFFDEAPVRDLGI